MAFRFSLDAVLRLRTSLERLEQLRLLALSALIVRLRQEIDSHHQQSLVAEQKLRQEMTSGIPAAELHFEVSRSNVRRIQHHSLELHLLEIRRRHQKQQIAFVAARRKREILENLRERQFAVYQREQARREQRQLDELFVVRLSSKPSD